MHVALLMIVALTDMLLANPGVSAHLQTLELLLPVFSMSGVSSLTIALLAISPARTQGQFPGHRGRRAHQDYHAYRLA
jgi:hypothetical protein